VALTLDRYERVDILGNNASELAPTPLPYLADYPPPAFDDAMQVNAVTPFRLTQALISSVLVRDRGSVPVKAQANRRQGQRSSPKKAWTC
jgi:NAD(P)-dependent dehydrogenase (short-subunit alcohol dehydrogenase family)